MIFNILLLLAANIFIPYLPTPPQLFIAYCGYEYVTKQVTIYDDMNMTRHYNEDQFKKSFRESLKKHHPDRGGNQQNFARIKAAKSIMEKPVNYYDLYNITSVDLKGQQSIEMAAEMKEMVYGFQTAIFYFIALLYFIAFTIDDKVRSSRKVLLPLTIAFAFYEFYIHWNPTSNTIFDLIDGKIPLFLQSILLKRFFCILTAIIRTRSLRKKNQEDILIQQIQKLPVISSYQSAITQSTSQTIKQSEQQTKQLKSLYLEKLKRLSEIEASRVQKMLENEKSFGTKIKNWISKGFSFLIFGLMIWGFISSSMGSSEKNINPEHQF